MIHDEPPDQNWAKRMVALRLFAFFAGFVFYSTTVGPRIAATTFVPPFTHMFFALGWGFWFSTMLQLVEKLLASRK